MALIKQIDTKYGDKAEYWKIIAWRYDPVSNYSTIEIAVYIDKKTRNDKKVFVDVYPYQTKGDISNKESMYNYIKTIKEFENAIDDIEE